MGEKPENKPVTPPKVPQEKEKRETPVPNFVEKLSVQEKRKLESTREALGHAHHEEKHEKEKELAEENLQKIKESFAPSLRNVPVGEKQTKLDDNHVNVEKFEDSYREQIKKTYETEMEELKNAPQKQKDEKDLEYIKTYTKDIGLDPKNIGEEDLQKLAKSLPEAWENVFVNPNIDLHLHPELALVREKIQEKLRSEEGKILKDSSRLSPDEVTKKLAENFQKITGIPTTPKTFKEFVSRQVDALPDSFTADGKKRGQTSRESFGSSPRRGFSAGGSSDVPSADNGSRDIPPVEASQMTINTYQWQGSGFKMRGPLKDLPKGTKGPPSLLAKLARQGTNPGGSTGTCYKSVKNHLCAAGYVDSSYKMTQGSAQNAGSDLQSIGFSNIGANIGNAQVGDVCVYSGGEHGHIEIKTEGGYASDFYANHPSGRTLIGVWRPPVSPVGSGLIASTKPTSGGH